MEKNDFLSQLIQREQSYILTEKDRVKIRQTLHQHLDRKTHQQERAEKKETNSVPLITDIVIHDEFQWFNYNEALDEVPYLFLFRIHLFPHLHYKTPMSLIRIQELCVMSGITNFTLRDIDPTTIRLSGDIEKGGLIKSIIMYLKKIDEKKVFISKCIFNSVKNK